MPKKQRDDIEWYRVENDSTERIGFAINGVSFIELVRAYEVTQGYAPSGSYAFLDYWTLSPPGEGPGLLPRWGREGDGRIVLLFCECGIAGCWDLICRITEEGDRITWSEFQQVHRGPRSRSYWNYAGFGPFRFDPSRYRAALTAIRDELSRCNPT